MIKVTPANKRVNNVPSAADVKKELITSSSLSSSSKRKREDSGEASSSSSSSSSSEPAPKSVKSSDIITTTTTTRSIVSVATIVQTELILKGEIEEAVTEMLKCDCVHVLNNSLRKGDAKFKCKLNLWDGVNRDELVINGLSMRDDSRVSNNMRVMLDIFVLYFRPDVRVDFISLTDEARKLFVECPQLQDIRHHDLLVDRQFYKTCPMRLKKKYDPSEYPLDLTAKAWSERMNQPELHDLNSDLSTARISKWLLHAQSFPDIRTLLKVNLFTPNLITLQSGARGDAWSVRDIEVHQYLSGAIRELLTLSTLWGDAALTAITTTTPSPPSSPLHAEGFRYGVNTTKSELEVTSFIKHKFDPDYIDAAGLSHPAMSMCEIYCLVFRPDLWVTPSFCDQTGLNLWNHLPLVRESRMSDMAHCNKSFNNGGFEGISTEGYELVYLTKEEEKEKDKDGEPVFLSKMTKERIRRVHEIIASPNHPYRGDLTRLPTFDYLINEFGGWNSDMNRPVHGGDSDDDDDDELDSVPISMSLTESKKLFKSTKSTKYATAAAANDVSGDSDSDWSEYEVTSSSADDEEEEEEGEGEEEDSAESLNEEEEEERSSLLSEVDEEEAAAASTHSEASFGDGTDEEEVDDA